MPHMCDVKSRHDLTTWELTKLGFHVHSVQVLSRLLQPQNNQLNLVCYLCLGLRQWYIAAHAELVQVRVNILSNNHSLYI